VWRGGGRIKRRGGKKRKEEGGVGEGRGGNVRKGRIAEETVSHGSTRERASLCGGPSEGGGTNGL